MQNLKSSHEEALIKKQLPILKTISAYAYSLDDDLRMELNGLIQSTEDKIHNLPTICEFNPKEFVYKLNKIKNKNNYLIFCEAFNKQLNKSKVKQQIIVQEKPVELKKKTERITDTPEMLSKGDKVVAEVIGRNGEILDKIYNVL